MRILQGLPDHVAWPLPLTVSPIAMPASFEARELVEDGEVVQHARLPRRRMDLVEQELVSRARPALGVLPSKRANRWSFTSCTLGVHRPVADHTR